ncbi:substrate-binding domain-containing protein [Paraburkholderia aromaticivorans]|uniref:substrate-binding domain-containing protein n=1 Tax=Paraburkholderia aromaticivorans TaxID=2026199 RepID=UPI0012FE2825|nr:substrate-binding domain-containing protein [Paraburkholderia aromaticivorans]
MKSGDWIRALRYAAWVAWGKQRAPKIAAANNVDLLWVGANMDVNTQISQMNGIIAENDDMAIGASQALKAKGLDGKIVVAGTDGIGGIGDIKDGMREVQSGTMVGTSLQNAALEMGEAVQVAVDYLQGRPDLKSGDLTAQ